MMVPDERLYAGVRAGDRRALAELVERYHAVLFKFLCRLTSHPQTAEDLTQETFVRLITFRGEAPRRFRPWIFTIANNLARDHFRSAAYRREGAGGFDDGACVAGAPPGLPDGGEIDVAQAIARLSPAHREVLVLRFYHDLKLEEIAEITGAPLGTVKSRLFHALRHLKGYLEATEVDEEVDEKERYAHEPQA